MLCLSGRCLPADLKYQLGVDDGQDVHTSFPITMVTFSPLVIAALNDDFDRPRKFLRDVLANAILDKIVRLTSRNFQLSYRCRLRRWRVVIWVCVTSGPSQAGSRFHTYLRQATPTLSRHSTVPTLHSLDSTCSRILTTNPYPIHHDARTKCMRLK